MARRILDEQHLHPTIRDKVCAVAPIVEEVEAAIARHPVVVVGMRQNPYPRKARQLLRQKGIEHHYLEYGSYLSEWRPRLELKLWSGWRTFPMIFVKGTLIGGFDDLRRLIDSGQLEELRSGAG